MKRAHRPRYDSTSPTVGTVWDGRSSGADARWSDIAFSDVVRVATTQDSPIGLAQDPRQARVAEERRQRHGHRGIQRVGWGRRAALCASADAPGHHRARRAGTEARRAARRGRAAARALCGRAHGPGDRATERRGHPRAAAVRLFRPLSDQSPGARAVPRGLPDQRREGRPARFRAPVGPGGPPPRPTACVGPRHRRESPAAGSVGTAPNIGESARGADQPAAEPAHAVLSAGARLGRRCRVGAGRRRSHAVADAGRRAPRTAPDPPAVLSRAQLSQGRRHRGAWRRSPAPGRSPPMRRSSSPSASRSTPTRRNCAR